MAAAGAFAPSRPRARCRRWRTAARRPTPPRRAHAPAQLVAAGQAEALGMLDHHQRRIGQCPRPTSITVVLTSTPMRPPRTRPSPPSSPPPACASAAGPPPRGVGAALRSIRAWRWRWSGPAPALLDQRADPVHLPAWGHLGPDALDHLVAPLLGNDLVTTGVRPGGSSSMVGDIEVGVSSSPACAGWAWRHHQQVGSSPVLRHLPRGRRAAPAAAKAVLLVDDGQRQGLNCTCSWITAWCSPPARPPREAPAHGCLLRWLPVRPGHSARR